MASSLLETAAMTVIESVSGDQSQILENIMTLCDIDRFDVDMTYGNGSFYKKIAEPKRKFDVDRKLKGVEYSNFKDLPLDDASQESVVFDPPFLTYVKNQRSHKDGKVAMTARFGGYWYYQQLARDYQLAACEASRILVKNGIFVVKCQDIIHNHKMHATHASMIDWCRAAGFRLKDLFVLTASHRMPSPQKGKQKHARVHHSYFLVFQKDVSG